MNALCRNTRRLTALATLLLALTGCAGMPAVGDGTEGADERRDRDGFYVIDMIEADGQSRSPAPERGILVETFGTRIRMSEYRKEVPAGRVWVSGPETSPRILELEPDGTAAGASGAQIHFGDDSLTVVEPGAGRTLIYGRR